MQSRQTEAQLMIEFAMLWSPWGGAPDEDILVRFGISSMVFYTRVLQLLEQNQAQLDHRKSVMLRAQCTTKLSKGIR